MPRPYSLVVSPGVDGVAESNGKGPVWDLLGDTLEAEEEVALEGSLEGLLGEGGDGCSAEFIGVERSVRYADVRIVHRDIFGDGQE